MNYLVALEDGTTGLVNSDTLDGQSADAFIGETINVHLHDENGNPIEVAGVLAEVLEEDE